MDILKYVPAVLCIASFPVASAAQEGAAAVSGDGSPVLKTESIEEVLSAVGKNNPALSAYMEDVQAQTFQMKGENVPEDPSVEYSSFYKGGITGEAGSELVVSQGFDFPTLYAARHRRNELMQASLDKGLENERRKVLLQAKNLCLDIIMYRQIGELLEMQSSIAGELLSLYSTRYDAGDASALEVNKIRMELMGVATAVAENSSALDAACRTLIAMNGGKEIDFTGDWYPLVEEISDPEAAVEEYLSSDAAVSSAENAAAAAVKDISVNRQGWIPRLEIGYRRNTEIREAEHGFIVGGSIPLYSNHRKVAMSKARSAAAHSNLSSVKLQAETDIRTAINEAERIKAAIEAYDEPLMRETLDLLHKAVEGGEISLIDYFVETSGIYENLASCIGLRNSWQKLMAKIYSNRL